MGPVPFIVTIENPPVEPPNSITMYWIGPELCPTGRCKLPGTGITGNAPALSARIPYKDLCMSIQIPSLFVETALVEIPQEGDSWAVETLGADAGLLAGTALPGKGPSIIAAHNTLSSTEYGPFAELYAMQENDRIFVTDTRGKHIYRGAN